jgi:hypothetical protein
VADYAHGEVKRVEVAGSGQRAAGRVTVIEKSHLPWSVVGGTYAPNGDLWLLEWSVSNEARVRRAASK